MSNDGGPAFPVGNTANMNGTMGMTLRDYFAGQALGGINANVSWDENGWMDRAKAAYSAADAMLASREEGQS